LLLLLASHLFCFFSSFHSIPTLSFPNQYDKSGRSTGLAYITFKSTTSAIEAKNEYDGAKAKGSPISIAFDQSALRYSGAPAKGGGMHADRVDGGRGGFRGGFNGAGSAGRGGKTAAGGDSLLGRISGKDLLSRLGER